jgi:hypothetical membrane protein
MGDRVIRAGAVAGTVAIGWFLAGTTLAGLLRPGYSMLAQPASDLGRGPLWWLFSVVLLGFAVLLVVFGIGFARWLPAELGVPRRRAIRAWLLVAAAGAACGAVFAEFHQGDRVIWHGILHGVGFLALLSGTIVAGWLTGAGLRRVPSTWSFGRWTHVSASVTSVLLVVDLVVPEVVPGIGGVLQRVLLLAAFSWHIVAGAYMLRTATPDRAEDRCPASYTPPSPAVDGTPAAAGLSLADGIRRAPRPPAERGRP